MTNDNRKINELKREMQRLYEEVKTLKIDIEPGGHPYSAVRRRSGSGELAELLRMTVGHISEGFDHLSEDMDRLRDEVRKNHYQLSHQINQVLARQRLRLPKQKAPALTVGQEVMLEAFTKLSDLPEE